MVYSRHFNLPQTVVPSVVPNLVSDQNIHHIMLSYSLPSDDRFMPSVGNGHLATNIFSDTVYMNGLYSGRNGESRRARIPAWANIRLNSTLTRHPYSPVYSLDTKHGVFQVSVNRERSIVTQRIFAHRYYTRSIVNQIKVEPKTHAGKEVPSIFST